VADISEAGRRASDVIARIRRFLRKGLTEPVELNVNDVIQDVIALTRETMQTKRVSIDARLVDDSPPIVGDSVQLQQVLINLVNNAVDAMSDINDRPRTLTITSSSTDEAHIWKDPSRIRGASQRCRSNGPT
jgi:C4-dicarboxylate-specific signal transduction histidine kinase